MKDVSGKLFVTQNIKVIEMLKSQLLSRVAELFECMNEGENAYDKRADIFTEIAIINYALAAKLGVNPVTLDLKIIKKLKLGVLEEDNILHDEVLEILRCLSSRA